MTEPNGFVLPSRRQGNAVHRSPYRDFLLKCPIMLKHVRTIASLELESNYRPWVSGRRICRFDANVGVQFLAEISVLQEVFILQFVLFALRADTPGVK